jgi:hypothetical protein
MDGVCPRAQRSKIETGTEPDLRHLGGALVASLNSRTASRLAQRRIQLLGVWSTVLIPLPIHL